MELSCAEMRNIQRNEMKAGEETFSTQSRFGDKKRANLISSDMELMADSPTANQTKTEICGGNVTDHGRTANQKAIKFFHQRGEGALGRRGGTDEAINGRRSGMELKMKMSLSVMAEGEEDGGSKTEDGGTKMGTSEVTNNMGMELEMNRSGMDTGESAVEESNTITTESMEEMIPMGNERLEQIKGMREESREEILLWRKQQEEVVEEMAENRRGMAQVMGWIQQQMQQQQEQEMAENEAEETRKMGLGLVVIHQGVEEETEGVVDGGNANKKGGAEKGMLGASPPEMTEDLGSKWAKLRSSENEVVGPTTGEETDDEVDEGGVSIRGRPRWGGSGATHHLMTW